MPSYLMTVLTRVRLSMRSERGASLVEYALLVALIAVVCIVAVTTLGQDANTTLSSGAGAI
ncbi:MAG: Flp family type IVb pilin [Acidimicrobiales bacterium]